MVLRLLRQLRQHDLQAGTTSARLSLLSLMVFAGKQRPSELAQAEQVSLPTISRMLKGMEEEGLIRRRSDPDDARASQITATAKGRRIIAAARQARLADLDARIAALRPRARQQLTAALPALQDLLAHAT